MNDIARLLKALERSLRLKQSAGYARSGCFASEFQGALARGLSGEDVAAVKHLQLITGECILYSRCNNLVKATECLIRCAECQSSISAPVPSSIAISIIAAARAFLSYRRNEWQAASDDLHSAIHADDNLLKERTDPYIKLHQLQLQVQGLRVACKAGWLHELAGGGFEVLDHLNLHSKLVSDMALPCESRRCATHVYMQLTRDAASIVARGLMPLADGGQSLYKVTFDRSTIRRWTVSIVRDWAIAKSALSNGNCDEYYRAIQRVCSQPVRDAPNLILDVVSDVLRAVMLQLREMNARRQQCWRGTVKILGK